MSKPTIRGASQQDWEQWLPLWEGYNTFYERIISAEVTKATWGRFFFPLGNDKQVHHALSSDDQLRLGCPKAE